MTPPPPLGGAEFVAWRLDQDRHKDEWDSGEGAFLDAGRWNSAGTRAVCCALDPADAILEVAVHVGFDDLDKVPRVLTSLTVLSPGAIRIVRPDDVPNSNRLRPGRPSADQQAFGDALLAEHGMFVIPSVVSSRSWNLVFSAGLPRRAYELRAQERFALDTRLAS